MTRSIQKAITAAFLLVTIVSSVLILYTANVYFIVFRSVRTFSVATPQLRVTVVNSSYILTKTNIIVQNPSELTFQLRMMRESLFLNGEFILSQTVSIPGWMEIEPESTAVLTIEADIPAHKLSFVEAHQDEDWLVYLRLALDAPLVDGYSWTNYWFITQQGTIQVNADEGHVTIRR